MRMLRTLRGPQTLETVAKQAGISKAQLSAAERGTRMLSLPTFARLVVILRVPAPQVLVMLVELASQNKVPAGQPAVDV